MTRKPLIGQTPLPGKLRPDCVGCGVKLKPNIWGKFEMEEIEGQNSRMRLVGREFDGTYGVSGLFHSRECAANYGIRIARQLQAARRSSNG